MMNTPVHLGFPAPLLGIDSLRLPVLFDDGELIALAKPRGVLVQADSWYPRLPVFVEAIRYQASQSKPEFQDLHLTGEGLWAIHDLDPECLGPVLFARNKAVAEELRSQLGSGSLTFLFVLVTPAPLPPEPVICRLPLARHNHLPMILVSHASGKRTQTTFTGLETAGSYAICLGRTAFPRRHQILLHAQESGLPVLGDLKYARIPVPLLSRLKANYRLRKDREESPLYDGPAYFLREITGPEGLHITCPPPPRWKALVRQLGKYSGH